MTDGPKLFKYYKRPPCPPPTYTTQGNVTVSPPDYTFQQLAERANGNTPGDLIFSALTWFGSVGTSVTFTATQPPGAPPFLAPPSILISGLEKPPKLPAVMPGPPFARTLPLPAATFLPPLPLTPVAYGGGGVGGPHMEDWNISLIVVGLVLGVSLILILLLIILWKRQRCCWGRKDGGMYEMKVLTGWEGLVSRQYLTSPISLREMSPTQASRASALRVLSRARIAPPPVYPKRRL